MKMKRNGFRGAGFTIVEVLMVVAIMSLLFGLVMYATTTVRGQASREATRALITRLRDALAEYKTITGNYPEDGFDSEVKNAQGTVLFGSAALHYALTRELTITETISGQKRQKTHPPLMAFKDVELTDEMEDYPGAREILDGYGVPIHYDNTQDRKFVPEKQGEIAHMMEVEEHPEDPRLSDDTEVVPHTGIQNPGAYDLWSHGNGSAHKKADTDPKFTIGSWNVESDKKAPKEGK